MFDHIGIAVSDLAASEQFYRTVLSMLGVEPSHADAELVEWEDWAIGPPDPEHPVTRGLHVGFRAPSRAAVDAFWEAGGDAGYRDDGAPGPRTEYAPDYYGGFLLDPDGNSAEAVHWERARAVPDGRIDHLWIRVADLAASKRFYTTIAPHAGIRLGDDEPGRVQFTGDDYSFSLIDDGRPLTEHVPTPRSPPAKTRRCARSTPPRSPRATRTTVAPASGSSTTRATTARSCWTPTGTVAGRQPQPLSHATASSVRSRPPCLASIQRYVRSRENRRCAFLTVPFCEANRARLVIRCGCSQSSDHSIGLARSTPGEQHCKLLAAGPSKEIRCA